MKIKTVTTVNGINPVYFGDYSPRFYWFKNLGDSTLYVSAKSNMIAGGDDVSELSPKSSTAIETTTGVIYVLGAGKVEIHNTDSKFCPFRGVAVVSGGGGESIKGTNFSIHTEGEPSKLVYADVYSYEDQSIAISSNENNFNNHLSTGVNSVLIGKINSEGRLDSTISTGSDIVMLNTKVEDSIFDQYNFVADEASTVFVYSERSVVKTYPDKAYCAWLAFNSWFTPMFVSLSNEGTTYTMYGSTLSALSPDVANRGGTFEMYGKTWYYCNCSPGSYQGAVDSSGLNRYYLGNYASDSKDDCIAIAKTLLRICEPDILLGSSI